MTPPPPPPATQTPVLEGAGALPEAFPAPPGRSPLDLVLAKGRLRATLSMLGPAFVAAIAYVDPGNFATNIQGGARFGYLLLWVVLVANLMAMLVQYLSAKLGIVTEHSLPALFRAKYPRSLSWGMWVQAEVMAMATDVAEFVGAALGLNLLFGVPLLPAALMTGVIAFAILGLQSRGYRRFELAITALLGIIFLGFLYETLKIGPSARESLNGLDPALRRQRQPVPGGRDHRRDRDAARDLPALGAHERAHAGARRARARARAALRADRRDRRAGPRGDREHGDARGRGEALPRRRRHRCEHDRAGPQRLRARWSAAARRSPSRSRCSPPARPPRALARTPARS